MLILHAYPSKAVFRGMHDNKSGASMQPAALLNLEYFTPNVTFPRVLRLSCDPPNSSHPELLIPHPVPDTDLLSM